MTRVCFVCLGNICRSPTAASVMRHLVRARGMQDVIVIESAGTAAYHTGDPPDRRSVARARARGIVVEGCARQFLAEDFARFDYVLALDDSNYTHLAELRPRGSACELRLLLDFDPESPGGSSVPDPYYGDSHGFDHVLDLCERACQGLLDHIVRSAKG